MSLLKKLNSFAASPAKEKPAVGKVDEKPTTAGLANLKIKETPKVTENSNSASNFNANSAQTDAGKSKQKFTIQDFNVDRTLGTGSFGRVHLVKLKSTSRYYAMKVLKKADVVKMKQVEHTINEKNALESIEFPFMVNMLGSFQDSRNLYLVLEYISGGELFTFLRRSGVSTLNYIY